MRFIRLFTPGRLLLVAILIAAGYLSFSAGTNLLHSYRLVNDENRLQDQVSQLQSQMNQLQEVRDYLRSDEYVEFMARRVFGLVMPGEHLVEVQAPQAQPPAGNAQQDLTWWQRLFGGQ